MNISFISLFPEIFDSFISTSLIKKAIQDGIIACNIVNPRDFVFDKHKQVDDEPYGWWAGLVLMAQPIIDCVKHIVNSIPDNKTFKILMMCPSESVFDQAVAHDLATVDHILFLCWRYEWFDHRVQLRCEREFWEEFMKISIGKFVTLGWEIPAMVVTESIVRLIPWVIWEAMSWMRESYRPELWWENIEHPHYTRPQEVEWFTVPSVLLSWNHAEIDSWRWLTQ